MQGAGSINSIVVSKDGRWIALLEFTQHAREVCAVDISNDSTKVVSVGGDTAQLFGTTSGIRLLPPLSYHWVFAVKFSPDSSRFATASVDSGLRVYDAHSGDILLDPGVQISIRSQQDTPLAWSSDSQQLFVASVGKITCFNIITSSSSAWSIHEPQSRVSITSNGRFIACSAGSSISLWDCASHKQIGCIIAHTAEINSIALSPSGGYLACGVTTNIIIHNLRDVLSPKYFDHHLPLVQMTEETLKSWTQDDPMNTEILLSEEIKNASTPSHYLLANRALIRARLKRLALAMVDVEGSLQVQPSPIGYIAMAIVLLGRGDREGALCTFDLAIHDCEPRDIRFLLLLKVLGAMCMKKGHYGRAILLIERAKNVAKKDKQCLPLKTISLIFGWSFNGLDIVAQQRLCETLYAEELTAEAVEILLSISRTFNEEIQGSKSTADWIAEFTKKCITTLGHVGDEASASAKHDDAIIQYSAALSLSPPSLAGLLIKRSRARAAKALWERCNTGCERVTEDPSYPWGYEAKHVALHGAKRYDEAIDAFKSMLHIIEQSSDPAIRNGFIELRKNYIAPSELMAAIDPIIRGILKSCPLVVIDVTTGCLCDGSERMRTFKAGPTFKELVLSMTRELDNERILRVVTGFFGYVMFSHAWQGNGPSYRDVNIVKSVWNLPDTPPNEKLRNLCKETRRLGHIWAWSDECCIDKTTSSVLNQSLTSMYKWYADSAATLVFLADVAHPTKVGDLTRSLWMAQAWTLQELLAPKVIFFYDSEWKPYLGDTGANHKESPDIMQELADAIKVLRGTIISSPDDLGVRDKLRLASTRNAMVEEDVAYSLIGIFKSDIRPHYGEGADALGHLLEEIVARSGEVTPLAWLGKSSSYNSCLPASISVYSQTPYDPPSLEGEEMETYIADLRGKVPQLEALSICNQINFLPPARFATRRLHLPCIVFSVRRLGIQERRRGNEKLYRARVSGLGKVEFTTEDDLSLHEPQKFVFVHPWIHHIRGPTSGITLGSDSESDTDSDSDSDSDGDPGSAPPLPLHDVPARQVDDYTWALQMIARLTQPLNALLLVQQRNGEYKRVAAENEIVVSGLGTDITSKNIRAKVLEIL
ncbi:hypothetical protein EDC04DRAFT_2889916 [Pisolithus marmoratus]|nr:hypothetical protein EDC04DRAFT_2889916 [Pisolithus marmoratus]